MNIILLALMFGQKVCAGDTEGRTELTPPGHPGDLGRPSSHIALHQACREGRLCMVQFIQSQNLADINFRDELGRTPVMLAALNGQVLVFDFLVGQGCDLSVVDDNNDNVLHVACEGGNTDIVIKLVNQKCDIEGRGRYGWTPVMRSVFHGHVDVFDVLVGKGCNLTIVDDYTNNILHVACIGGHVDMVKHIIAQHTFSIDVRGSFWRTPIMIAAYSGHKNVVDFFWSEGVNSSVVDKHRNNILHAACMGGHVDVVKQLLLEINIDSRGYQGRTPVMAAACSGQTRVVQFLVRKGCKLSKIDEHRNNVLHVGCMGGHVDVVKYILSLKKFDIDSRGNYGRTPAMFAALFGNKNAIYFLLSRGCKLSEIDEQERNILHLACIGGHVDVVRYILSLSKIDINSKGLFGRTPAMLAAYYGQRNVISYILSRGCKLSEIDEEECNILHLACMGGHVDVVKYIVSLQKIDINSRGNSGRTPAMEAAFYGHKNVVFFLVSKGYKVAEKDEHENNILHFACIGGHVDVVRYILSLRKININSKGLFGRTPAMAAAYYGHKNVISFLVSKGCKLSEKEEHGDNVLHLACVGGHLDVVKYILSLKKIDINSRGAYGWTPMMTAAYSGQKNVISFLMSKGCKLRVVDNQGNNVLHIACIRDNTEMVKYLMKIRSIVEMKRGRNKSSQTPVQLAVARRHRRVAALLKAG